jgi:hypothetical protein
MVIRLEKLLKEVYMHKRLAVSLFLLLFCVVSGAAPNTYYVDASRPDDSGKGVSWADAKKTIQAAVDLCPAGYIVMVTNGTYNTGGALAPDFSNSGTTYIAELTNRVCITNAVTVKSVNGPDVTFIVGAAGSNGSNDVDSVRGAYLIDGARLDGFTVTNGYTIDTSSSMDGMGGGIWAGANSVATNCIITGCLANNVGGGAYMYFGGHLDNCRVERNRARSSTGGVHGGSMNNSTIRNNSSYQVGGTQSCDLNRCIVRDNLSQTYGGGCGCGILSNCLIVDNKAKYGGGACYAVLKNCTVAANTALIYGGGAHNCDVTNSVVWGNSAGISGNDILVGNGSCQNSCASDGLTDGVDGCITSNPRFVDAAGGNYSLKNNSPCINRGINSAAPMPFDLAGNARIVDALVDMGACEWFAPLSFDVLSAIDLLLLGEK